jgi:hypothetical protein
VNALGQGEETHQNYFYKYFKKISFKLLEKSFLLLKKFTKILECFHPFI